ncbi:hypothetical protein [Streptomyces sp. NPDC101115]|uniref:hypothetical protein n=1 Tax=Streptomyces sp. NPDC101115 TaxID=3366106 RepID=UPI0037FDF0F6
MRTLRRSEHGVPVRVVDGVRRGLVVAVVAGARPGRSIPAQPRVLDRCMAVLT